jgi:hypothetical protein
LASTYDSDVAVRWNELLYSRIKAEGIAPPPAARIYAYSNIALYESIVAGMPDHQTLQAQLNAFPAGTIPAPVALPHHWPTVANRTLALLAAGFLGAGSDAPIATLEGDLQTPFSAAQPADVITRSQAYGDAVAAAVLAWAATDGSADPCTFAPTVPPASGGWTPVPPATGVGAFACWGSVRTFVVADGLECAPVPPPTWSSSTSSAWYAQALLVYNTTGDAGANLTTDQNDIARYWADNATATGTPGGHWIAITCQLSAEEPLMLDRSAEAFARVGLAIHDAFVTCWKEKFTSYLMRPITYIQQFINGVGDPTWDPLIGTPNFPTYSSGHSTQSGAAATVLTQMFGVISFTDTCHSRLNPGQGLPADRAFTSFYDAAAEAALSRMYGGIHYAFDNYEGFDSGVCVGNTVSSQVQFLAP